MKKISSENAPAAIGPYCQAVEANGFIFTSGQLGINPETGELEDGISQQCVRACENLSHILRRGGSSLDRVVKTTCYLKNISDFAVFNEIYAKYFTGVPARSCFEVAALPKGGLVEIEVIAQI